MKNLIRALYQNSIVRYVFFGGCTTAVNLASFYVLRKAGVNLHGANLISIAAAIIFAYVVNSRYVFQDPCETFSDHIRPFIRFIGARLVTMAVEVGGVWLLVDKIHMQDMAGKFAVQFLVIVLNYVFSKLFVFTGKRAG